MLTRPRVSARRVPVDGQVVMAGLLLLLIFAVYAWKEHGALSVTGLTNLANDMVVLGVLAVGLTTVLLTGGFDLSAIGVVALTNVVAATVVRQGPGGALLTLLLLVLIGAGVGAINGLLVAVVQLQPLATTLATMTVCAGLALLIMPAPGGQVADAIAYGMTGILGPVPVGVLVLAAVLGLWWVIRRTRFGLSLYAVGTDETAARLSGVHVAATRFFAYTLGGALYGLGGFMLSAITGAGDPRLSNPLLLLAFAAVAIGGTSFAGGRGGAYGSVLGAGVLSVMQKMLFALGASAFYTSIFQGAMMILAVLFAGASAVLTVRARQGAARPTDAAPLRSP
jgi:ribose transport system permease protein